MTQRENAFWLVFIGLQYLFCAIQAGNQEYQFAFGHLMVAGLMSTLYLIGRDRLR